MKPIAKFLKSSFPFWMLKRDLRLIFVSRFVGSFGDGLYSYLLPRYITENLAAGSVEVGILYAILNLVAALTLFLAGMVADKYDRKKIMVLGWVIWMPAPIIFSLAENWLQMLPGMILYGFWIGGPTVTAYIIITADRGKLTLTFTTLSVAWSMGYTFAPALGGYLSESVGMGNVFYLAFVLYTLAAVSLCFVRSQYSRGRNQFPLEEKLSFHKILKTRKLLSLSLFFALIFFVLMLSRPFLPQFLGEIYKLNDFEIGVLGSISFFGASVLATLLGKIGDRWGKAYAVAISMLLCCFSISLIILSDKIPVLLPAFFLIGGSYTTWSLMGALMGNLAPEAMQARWISIPQTIAILASFTAPYIGGTLYSVSPYYPFIVAIVTTPLIAIISLTSLLESA